MNRKYNLMLIACLAAMLQQLPAQAQLSPKERNESIDSLLQKLQENYVFPDVATAMVKKVKQLQAQKKYDSISDGNVLASQLTADLRSVSHDQHISVGYSQEAVPADLRPMELPAAEKASIGEYMKHDNYGIGKVEVLKGNTGYIDFKYLVSPEFAGDTYAAMMNYVAHTDALIIDLRRCGGSMSMDAVPFILSYFFESPVHLNDWFWRKDNTSRQSWTYAYVPGKKYLTQPIYVLTSEKTFSGAEEMAYDLQNLKRATLIGEKTGGGANPGGDIYVTQHFRMFVPVGKSVNPITHTNWEGVGVQPDSTMKAGLALHHARLLIINNMLKNVKDEGWKGFLQQTISEIEKEKPVYASVSFVLKGFEKAKEVYVTGSFNDWSPVADKMQKQNGEWVLTTQAEAGKLVYKFIVDGVYITDPANANTEQDGANNNSVKFVEQKAF